MRPLHALLLIAGLALALLAALFLIGSDPRGTAPAPAAAPPPAAGTPKAASDAVLQAPEDENSAARAAKPAVAAQAQAPVARSATLDASGFALSGRVVTSSGKPIADATVYAASAQGISEIALDEIDPAELPWLRRVDARTGSDGRFALRPQVQGAVRIAVRAGGYAPHDADVSIAGTAQDLGDIVLDPGVVLTGRVVDSGHRPVPDAAIFRKKDSGGGIVIFGGAQGAPVAKTDAEGHFKVDQLAVGPWKLAIVTDDHPDKIESGETNRPGSTVANLEFVLEDGVEIRGHVVGAPENALANLWVRASPRPSAGDESGVSFVNDVSGTGAFSPGRRAKCGADGAFALRGLKSGQAYRLVARDNERDFAGHVRTGAVQAKGGDRDVKLTWKPETALVFQVVDAVTSKPITDFGVEAGYGWALPLRGDDGKPVKHFPDGRVRFTNLPQKPEGATAELAIEAVGYQRFERKDLQVVEGQDLDLGVIPLARAPLVKVLVLDDATGEPVANASVNLAEQREPDATRRIVMSFGAMDEDAMPGPGSSQRARTGADGRALVTSLPGKRAVVSVRHAAYAPYSSEPLALPVADDIEQTVRMHVGGTVVVTVVDSKGRPVAAQGVQHRGVDGNEPPLEIGGDARDETDARGELVFEHLEPGLHKFRLRDHPDDMMSVGPGAVVRAVRKGGPAQGDGGPPWSEVAIVERGHEALQLIAPARSTLSGRISEGGKPLASAVVRMSDPNDDAPELPFFGEGRDVRANAKGEYTFDNVKQGDYRVTVTHPTRAMSFESRINLAEGDNNLDIDMPVSTIEGRVTTSDKKPIAGVRVRAERATPGAEKHKVSSRVIMLATDDGDNSTVSFSNGSGGGEAVVTDADGRYKLRGVLADVDLVVKASGKDVQPGESAVVRVSADQSKAGVDLTLEQGGSIEVTVQHADGRAGNSCLVRGRIDGDAVDPKTEFSGASGVVKLTGLRPGKWHVNVTPIGPSAAGSDKADVPEQIIEVKAGEMQKARFEIP